MVPKKSRSFKSFHGCQPTPLTYFSATKVRLRNIFLAFDQGGEFCLFSARHGPSSRARRGLGSRMTWTSMQKKTPKETWPRFRMHATQQNFGIIIYPCAHMKILLWHTVSCLLLIAVVVQVAVVKITKFTTKATFLGNGWAMATPLIYTVYTHQIWQLEIGLMNNYNILCLQLSHVRLHSKPFSCKLIVATLKKMASTETSLESAKNPWPSLHRYYLRSHHPQIKASTSWTRADH